MGAEEVTQDATPVVEQVHPLASVKETIGTWSRWKERWSVTKNVEEMLGLLHCGFTVTVSGREGIERICFYLDIADGHTSLLNFRFPSSQQRFFGEDMSKIRQSIARKAFEIVTNAVFKNRSKGGDHPSWLWLVDYPELVDKVLWFFRTEEDRPCIKNAGSYDVENTVYSEIVHVFLSKFVTQRWCFANFIEYASNHDRVIQRQLRERRPRFIEILWGIGELEKLFSRNYELDKACLAKLEELAFRQSLQLPTKKEDRFGVSWDERYRKPISLAEAHYGGSMPAIVLTHRRIVAEEQKRFDQLRDLAERRDELERAEAALRTSV